MAELQSKVLVNAGAAKASAWFLQNSLDAFVGLRDGLFAWANPTWTALTGWSTPESAGRPYRATFLLAKTRPPRWRRSKPWRRTSRPSVRMAWPPSPARRCG